MIKQIDNGEIEISKKQLKGCNVYTDRNGVFNKANVSKEVLENVKQILGEINKILDGNLSIISNESEDCRKDVLDTDKKNGFLFEEENYKLSTMSAAKFILEHLKFPKCYFIGNESVSIDINNLGLKTINISDNLINDKNELLVEDIPILFGRPLFAINSRFNSEDEIEQNIGKDIAFQNVEFLLKNIESKIIFCHTKQNCNRKTEGGEYREINLGYYFEKLVGEYGLEIGKNIFDLGKGRYSKGDFFDMALGIKDKNDYKNVLGIGDMFTDIEHVLKNGGNGILVESGDEIIDETLIQKIKHYKNKIFVIKDLSMLKIS